MATPRTKLPSMDNLALEWLNFGDSQFADATNKVNQFDTWLSDWQSKAGALNDEQLALARRISGSQAATADTLAQQAVADRARYDTTFRPLEDKLVADAQGWDSPERQAEAAARARADVQTASSQGREQALRQASSLGINPASGRFAGIDRAGELGTALASVGAQNEARDKVRGEAQNLRLQAIGLGQELPGRALNAATTGANMGSAALNSFNPVAQQTLANDATGIQLGAQNLGLRQAASGFKTSGLNAALGAQGANAERESADNSSLWGAIGTIGGGLLSGLGGISGIASLFSSEELKEEKAPIPEGAALEAVEEMPVESWRYKQGVADGGAAPHIGGYAENFAEVTGRGDGTTIPVQDALGLTMKAVQDLNSKVDRLAEATGVGLDRTLPVTPRRRIPGQPGPTGLGMQQAA